MQEAQCTCNAHNNCVHLDVDSCAEGPARRLDDHHARVVWPQRAEAARRVGKQVEDGVQLTQHLHVDGVERPGAVERYPQDGAAGRGLALQLEVIKRLIKA
jgi:hypothetical protein